MLTTTPEKFLLASCTRFAARDHHFSGPLHAQQSENRGSVFHEEGLILAGLAAKWGGPVLEIGADLGVSTRYISEGLDRKYGAQLDPGLIYSVDVHHKWHDSRDWPRRVRVDHDSTTYKAPRACKWAFIDGDHRYEAVLKDTQAAIDTPCPRLLYHDTVPGQRKARSTSDSSDARDAVLDYFKDLPDWTLLEITTHCGLILATWDGAKPR